MLKKRFGMFCFLFLFCFYFGYSAELEIEGVPSFIKSNEKYFIVEFSEIIYEDDKEKLIEVGVNFISFVGDNSFLVKFDVSLVDDVLEFDFVESVARNKKPKVSKVARESTMSFSSMKSEEKMFTIEVLDESVLDLLIDKVENLNGKVLDIGKKKVRVLIDSNLVDSLLEFEEVNLIEPFSFMKILNDDSKGYLNVYNHFDNFGLYGEGQTVAVADTGLDIGIVNSSLHGDFLNKTVFIENFIWDNLGNDGASDLNSGHGTHVSGSVLGTGVLSGANLSADKYTGSFSGTAPKADLYFQAMEVYCDNSSYCGPSLGNYVLLTPSNLVSFFQPVYDAGGRIHTNSWGGVNSNGTYTSASVDVDEFMWNNKDFKILFAAGNSGPDSNTVLSPGTSKNVITVGNVNGDSAITSSSSRGPTDDGRIKPDVLAPGYGIISARSHIASGTLWGIFNSDYLYSGGTSMATPLAAGIVALLSEYLDKNKSISNPSSALIKAMLINGARNISSNYVDMDYGWGIIDLNSTIYEDENFNLELFDISSGLSTGSEYVYNFTINKVLNPLRVTVVWTDYPGTAGAGIKLVNNLDVVLVGPDGSKYFGNDFSAPFDDSSDSLNNVEGIRIASPIVGEYSLIVNGTSVNMGGSQPFAVVITRDDFDLPVVENVSPSFGSDIYSSDLLYIVNMNFSKDITSLSYFNGSSDVDLSSYLVLGNLYDAVLNASSFGSQSVLFNFTDSDGINNSHILNFTLVENLAYILNFPLNNSQINLSKLSFFMNISFNQNISSFLYEIDGSSFNVSDLVDGSDLIDYLDIPSYGLFNVSFFYEDFNSRRGNFTLLLNFTSNLGFNLTDFDEDGINNSDDKLIGNSSNINSNFGDLNVTVNLSSNLSQLFNDSFEVVISNSSYRVIEFVNNFSTNTIDLSKVIVKSEVISNKSKFFVNGLDLEAGKTKTIYLKLAGDVSMSRSLCLKDSEVFSLDEISLDCNGNNETFISSVPVVLNGYNVTYTDVSNATVKIAGLSHSGVAQMCTESWSYGSWGTCSSSSQSRSAVDLNSCDTFFDREVIVQSCSSGSTSGGGGGGGFTPKVVSEEIVSVEESEPSFSLIFSDFDNELNVFINSVKKSSNDNFSNVKLVKLKDESSLDIISFVYNFSAEDLMLSELDFSYNFDNISFIDILGLKNVEKSVKIKNNLNFTKVCVSDLEILNSKDCSLDSEKMIHCDGEDYFGFTCDVSNEYYLVSGVYEARVFEFDVVVTSKETYLDSAEIGKYQILEDNISSELKMNDATDNENVDDSKLSKYLILSGLIVFAFFMFNRIIIIRHRIKKHKKK